MSKIQFSQNFLQALSAVNNDIAADLDTDDEYVMAETCLDAGRLEMSGHLGADAELRGLISHHGWHAVVTEAAKHVSLY